MQTIEKSVLAMDSSEISYYLIKIVRSWWYHFMHLEDIESVESDEPSWWTCSGDDLVGC